ncbi:MULTISPECIES: phosphate regulon transcriptional regulator PhoB [Psychrobacter]|jgi:two-component system phosphate regulon response regulator PhoB|uniref:Phosphate regulon transcriptional regulatory protein PhoB n=2 Tax=Psychrobacter TaxID=497 RepID=A0A6N7BUK7_9GAMM|nr:MULTISPECIES: phosphate regulon transcriptional regulator PhoB [Psychrobacter]KAF0567739.1 Phosphate regulon transcriptional regulatory protein PhoB (SphR) [Psychrobacter nivimaris]KRG33124.1 chemotaxis protein CheY [Psychrobacter sp. P11G3]MBA6244246.1 phosphate regulon transcriptional regulator PhoB [Psychrobacter sp. Urea-trap-18]MBA6286620.1 phosphate regulon transcriptional regulator PhoB [Psychrobacter sp. Urea-trap-16]MBA6317617.1 phosphate regulon transcriptional regulator PhoB [Psy|tara:strand:+ start:44828 stop:45532 length:705 start_codon:yes stop_codon:yes gene_type:complete
MYNEQILIVEDEPAIREMVVMTLEMAGFDSLQAADVSEAHQQVVDHRPSLILLDWMLPGDKSGVDFCRMLKNDELLSEIPVIMLTAKSEEDSKVHGLDAGADDYMTKPFSTRELISRIKAVLRRSSAMSSDKPIEIGQLSLDTKSQRVTAAGKIVDVGPTEYRLLAFFMSHPERAYTRTQLLDQVWGGNVYIEDRTIDVHIKRLRKLLRPYDCDTLIQTVRGTGYRFSSLIEPS